MQKWSRGVFKIISIILLSVGVYSFIGHYQSQNEIYEPQDFSIIINNGVEELSSEINQLVNAARLFKNEEIPWKKLAFPFVPIVLKHYFEDRKNKKFDLKIETIERPPKKTN